MTKRLHILLDDDTYHELEVLSRFVDNGVISDTVRRAIRVEIKKAVQYARQYQSHLEVIHDCDSNTTD
jgi:hypothetical protein